MESQVNFQWLSKSKVHTIFRDIDIDKMRCIISCKIYIPPINQKWFEWSCLKFYNSLTFTSDTFYHFFYFPNSWSKNDIGKNVFSFYFVYNCKNSPPSQNNPIWFVQTKQNINLSIITFWNKIPTLFVSSIRHNMRVEDVWLIS